MRMAVLKSPKNALKRQMNYPAASRRGINKAHFSIRPKGRSINLFYPDKFLCRGLFD